MFLSSLTRSSVFHTRKSDNSKREVCNKKKRDRETVPKKRRGTRVARGSPAGVMGHLSVLSVLSVLIVLIGTCPYFLSTDREIVVWSKREPYKAVQRALGTDCPEKEKGV